MITRTDHYHGETDMTQATGSGAAEETQGAAAHEAAGDAAATQQESPLVATFKPLLLDIAIPVGGYYLLHAGFGVGLVMSLALSSVVPAIRTITAALRDRSFNGLAGLMLVVNMVGIALSFLTGDPRLMIAKDSGISSVVGVVILASAFRGTPMMSAGLKPMLTKGKPDRTAAWHRLAAGDAGFQRLERVFSGVWGSVLLAECVARIIGAYTLPVSTMVWMGTLFLLAAIGLGIVLGGVLAANRMEQLVAEGAATLEDPAAATPAAAPTASA